MFGALVVGAAATSGRHVMLSANAAMSSLGHVDYASKEQQALEAVRLKEFKSIPHNPAAIASQFSHGINAHLPHGVTGNIDRDRYWKDPVSQLIFDRVETVTDEQRQQLIDLCRELAPSSVAYDLKDITGYTGVEEGMKIDLVSNRAIISPPKRNFTQPELDIIKEKCEELLRNDVIVELQTSKYACNPVLAMKRAPDGTWSDKRFCVNYTRVNKDTELDRYGTHRAEELYRKVVRAKYLTALDLRSGFHQIPIYPPDISKTAFWWVSSNMPPRLMAYKRMPFGLKNAPAKFQRVMDTELARAGCTDFAFAYIDDLIIASDSWEEHVEHVGRVLRCLANCHLRIHPGKSVFGTNIVEYLGHNVLGGQGITMNEAKVVAIKALPNPSNLLELRSILGFLSYYRHFIPGFSSIAAPMTKLLQKNQPWEWGPQQQEAYDKLRAHMTEPGRILRPIDSERELIVHTDWSIHGIGAVLGQKDEEGREYLCACISRSLNKHERNYPSYKGELLALAWAIRMFRQHLLGTKFKVVTDHQPLLWLMRARDLNGQYARWQLLLQEYDFEVEHRAGVKHQNADTLSRFPCLSPEDFSGARFDEEVPADPVSHVALATAGIDTYAPTFKDLLGSSKTAYFSEHYYANAAMQSGSDSESIPDKDVPEEPPEVAEGREALRRLVADLKPATTAALTGRLTQANDLSSREKGLLGARHSGINDIDTRPLTDRFFSTARGDGIALIELCAGMCSGLEMMLRAGVRVNRYYYVDIDPKARAVADFRVANFSAIYPNQFPPNAWKSMYQLPQDLNHVNATVLEQVLTRDPEQWVLVAGWPCQDYSAAGLGRIGKRAMLLDQVVVVLKWLQGTQSCIPPAYLLENVAMQHNFRHAHVRYPIFESIVRKLGSPLTFDAAQVGSYAHRVRNYWTNLCTMEVLQGLYDQIESPHGGKAIDVLGPGRVPMPVDRTELTVTRKQYNVPGRPRVTFPTLMSYHRSRAFRAGQPGSVYDLNLKQFTEPEADERERMMGYAPSTTAAPGISDRERCEILGQAMDINALCSIWALASAFATPENQADMHSHALHNQQVLAVRCKDSKPNPFPVEQVALTMVQGRPTDVWEDLPVMTYLRTGQVPNEASERSRVLKRARPFQWRNNRLYREVAGEDGPSCRIVPPVADREAIISHMHVELGHLGEKRTTQALSQTYWWSGLTLDVRRVLSACKLCRRVQASEAYEPREMLTSPPTYGMFYRWGIDHIGPLSPSAAGNTYVLVFIDYFSKWIEAIPCNSTKADVTMKLFHLHVVSRFGVPAEIITDNGPAFSKEFSEFCVRKGINHRKITADVPRSNGLAEKAVETIKHAIIKHVATPRNVLTWDTEGLANILLGYRCTPQAATKFSPAQIVFAQNLAATADAHELQVLEPLDYDNPVKAAKNLLLRAEIAARIAPQVVRNLQSAHERNAERFKAVRSGKVVPKVHHFRVGDFVFLLYQDKADIPGGALGMRAKDEIVKVVEVRSQSGVLVVVNQSGQRFSVSMEHCAPCTIPNLDGTTHSGISMPSKAHPCTKCGSAADWGKMLLCDWCDAGWHLYCLTPPLVTVPAGDWLCPDCKRAGVSLKAVHERRNQYIPPKISHPAAELPSPSRRKKAQRLAAEWHGAAIVHTTAEGPRYGRVVFHDILAPKWFKVHWEDGEVTEADLRLLRRFGKVDEVQAPRSLIPIPEPVAIFNIHPVEEVFGSLVSFTALHRRLDYFMQGLYTTPEVQSLFSSLPVFGSDAQVGLATLWDFVVLLKAFNLFRMPVILDPWALHGNLQDALHNCEYVGSALANIYGQLPADYVHAHDVSFSHNPLEVYMYDQVARLPGPFSVVTSPPVAFLDIVLPVLAEYVTGVACVFVPVSYLTSTAMGRFQYLFGLQREGRLLQVQCVREGEPDARHDFCWLCIFRKNWQLSGLMQVPFSLDMDLIRVIYPEHPSPRQGKDESSKASPIKEDEAHRQLSVRPVSCVGDLVGFTPAVFSHWQEHVDTPQQLARRLAEMVPGVYSAHEIKQLFGKLARVDSLAGSGPAELSDFSSLMAHFEFLSTDVVLDPWAAAGHLAAMECEAVTVPNVFGKSGARERQVAMNPLCADLYEQVESKYGNLAYIITSPPVELIDVQLPLLLAFARRAVCVYVPESYVTRAPSKRQDVFQQYADADRLLPLRAASDSSCCWLCFFSESIH